MTLADVTSGNIKAHLIEGDIFGAHRVTSTLVPVKRVRLSIWVVKNKETCCLYMHVAMIIQGYKQNS